MWAKGTYDDRVSEISYDGTEIAEEGERRKPGAARLDLTPRVLLEEDAQGAAVERHVTGLAVVDASG